MGVVNTTTTISSDDRALLEARIATEQQQIFRTKAVLLNRGIPAVKPLAGNQKSETWHWEGFGTGSMQPKAKGSARARSTTPKSSKTIAFDGPEYYTEGFDWFDSSHFPTWPVLQNAVRRGNEKYVDKAETRMTILGAIAAQAAADSGVHLGGVTKQVTAASVAAAFAATNTGAETFAAACAEIDATFMTRQETVGMNRLMLTTPYIARQVIPRSDKFMSKDYNNGGDLANGSFVGNFENYPILASRYLAAIGGVNNNTDNISKYQLDCTVNSGSKLGIPVALFFHYDANYSPIGRVESYKPTSQVWYETDEDENVCGIKSLEGLDTLHVWCAGGIFVHS
jgi:hypothetical protein